MARTFDGSNDYLRNASFTVAASKTKFTLSAFMKRASGGKAMFGCWDSSTNNLQHGFAVLLWSDGNAYVMYGNGNSSQYAYVANATYDTFVHVFVHFDGGLTGNSNRLKVWIDGVQQTLTFNQDTNTTTSANLSSIWVGARPNGPEYGASSVTRLAAWHGVDMGETEADAIAGGTEPDTYSTGLIDYWPCPNTTGDEVGTTYTLTDNGGVGGEADPDFGGAGAQTIICTGIASAEAFGTAVVAPGAVTVTPTGIASAEAFGTATVTPGAVTITPAGIATLEEFGSPTVSPGAFVITAPSIDSAEAFGSAVASAGGASIVPTGIASAEAFGTATVAPGAATITPAGIATLEEFGSPIVTAGGLLVFPEGIASLEAFGSATLSPGGVSIAPAGIASAEAFGTTLLTSLFAVAPTGIASAEAFGTAVVAPGAVIILPTSIASLEAFGATVVLLEGAAVITNILDREVAFGQTASRGVAFGSTVLRTVRF